MTRGYFTLINTHDDLNDPYQRYDNILVEACGDGYFDTVMEDIFSIGEEFAKNYIKRNNIGKVRLLKELRKEQPTFSKFLNEAGAILLFDLTWVDFLGLLQFTVPFRYAEIDEGVKRYGSKVGFDSSYFNVTFTPSRYSAICKIKFDQFSINSEDIEHIKHRVDVKNAEYVYCKECQFELKDYTLKFDLLRQIYFKLYTS